MTCCFSQTKSSVRKPKCENRFLRQRNRGAKTKKDLQTETKDLRCGLLLLVATVLYNLWKSWGCHFPLRVLTDIKKHLGRIGTQQPAKPSSPKKRCPRSQKVDLRSCVLCVKFELSEIFPQLQAQNILKQSRQKKVTPLEDEATSPFWMKLHSKC